MTAHHDPAVVAALQEQFALFSGAPMRDDPLNQALCAIAARRADLAGLLAHAPAPQRIPLLWLAALQDRVLAQVAAGERPALADYYASAGPARAPDAALEAHLADFVARHRDALARTIATRTTQTNEIGRCAVLWPILQGLSEATDGRPIALLDVGCSAGLNLGVDHWRYRYVDDATGATIAATPPTRDARAPEIACRVLAGTRAGAVGSAASPRIVSRAGIDQAPVSVDDDIETRWLRACLWPGDAERRQRFDAAVAIARTQRWPLAGTTDAAASVQAWLRDVPGDVTPVIFNSWVLYYFDAPSLRRHVEVVLGSVARQGAVWISAEDPTQSRAWWPAKPGSAADQRPNATAWTLARPDGRGGVAWTLAATSHAHGRWMLCEG
jgi:hypothetical protein